MSRYGCDWQSFYWAVYLHITMGCLTLRICMHSFYAQFNEYFKRNRGYYYHYILIIIIINTTTTIICENLRWMVIFTMCCAPCCHGVVQQWQDIYVEVISASVMTFRCCILNTHYRFKDVKKSRHYKFSEIPVVIYTIEMLTNFTTSVGFCCQKRTGTYTIWRMDFFRT